MSEKKSSSHYETVNGRRTLLGPTEMVEDEKCPECGADLITNYGPGISITWCEKCGYSFTDYD